MSDSTPGPWIVETLPSDHGGSYITGHIISPRHTYAGNTVSRRDSITDPNSMTRADAYLIAAAPDLYAALKAVVEVLRKEAPGTLLNHMRYDALGVQAYAALRKAEGGI